MYILRSICSLLMFLKKALLAKPNSNLLKLLVVNCLNLGGLFPATPLQINQIARNGIKNYMKPLSKPAVYYPIFLLKLEFLMQFNERSDSNLETMASLQYWSKAQNLLRNRMVLTSYPLKISKRFVTKMVDTPTPLPLTATSITFWMISYYTFSWF